MVSLEKLAAGVHRFCFGVDAQHLAGAEGEGGVGKGADVRTQVEDAPAANGIGIIRKKNLNARIEAVEMIRDGPALLAGVAGEKR